MGIGNGPDQARLTRPMQREKIKVLFVCMGNICRSPMAEGVFKSLVEQHGLDDVIHVESAGTHASRKGEPPDPRAIKSARSKGYDISFARARAVSDEDISLFDYILAMDQDNFDFLLLKSEENCRGKVELFLNHHPHKRGQNVPDPYYRDQASFNHAVELIESACWELLKTLRDRHEF